MMRFLVVSRGIPALALLVLAGVAASCLLGALVRPVFSPTARLQTHLEEFFALRARSLVSGDAEVLKDYYDTSRLGGKYAWEHELARVRLASDWFRKRRVSIVAFDPLLTVVDAGVKGDRAWASVCQHLRIRYLHETDPSSEPSLMGTRTMHWLELVRKDGRWLVERDWFWDPYKDDNRPGEAAPLARRAPYRRTPAQGGNGTAQAYPEANPGAAGRLNRRAAVEYADRYCGVRAGLGDGRYNPAYRDYTGVGGDCANFVSQVLSDPRGGGMPLGGIRTRADDLVHYLLGSGRGVLVGGGSFEQVTAPTPEHPDGPVFSLEPGDVIGYVRNGQISHVSVVVGRDGSGYPVVNSHTGDRYHVPFDLGYDSRTKYWLVHLVW